MEKWNKFLSSFPLLMFNWLSKMLENSQKLKLQWISFLRLDASLHSHFTLPKLLKEKKNFLEILSTIVIRSWKPRSKQATSPGPKMPTKTTTFLILLEKAFKLHFDLHERCEMTITEAKIQHETFKCSTSMTHQEFVAWMVEFSNLKLDWECFQSRKFTCISSLYVCLEHVHSTSSLFYFSSCGLMCSSRLLPAANEDVKLFL